MTVEFVIVDLETLEVRTVSVTDTVQAGTEKPLTCTDWTPELGAYSVLVTGQCDEETTSTRIIDYMEVVPYA